MSNPIEDYEALQAQQETEGSKCAAQLKAAEDNLDRYLPLVAAQLNTLEAVRAKNAEQSFWTPEQEATAFSVFSVYASGGINRKEDEVAGINSVVTRLQAVLS